MSDTPKLMANALRILAGDIQAPDDVPSMCLLNAASMIEQMEKQLAAERGAHLETRKMLEQLAGCVAEYLSTRKRDVLEDLEVAIDAAGTVITAARAAVAKASEKDSQSEVEHIGWTGKKCQKCGGTGESPEHDHLACLACGGTGDEYSTDIKPSAAVVKEDEKEGQP